MKKKTKDDIGCFLWCLFYLIIIIVGAYMSYIEWSNKFMLHDYLKNEVKK